MRHVLAIDQGTTGSTCLVIGADGQIKGRGYREIPQYYPRPGWVEHNASEIFDCTVAAAREAVAHAGVSPDVMGITNQRETVVLWDRHTGEPVTHAIVWQDRRTAWRCRELGEMETMVAQLTGLVIDPYFSATKLEWILTEEKLAERARRGELAAGTIDSWLVWKLTGGKSHVTDYTNASRTMLFDIEQLEWHPRLLDLFSVPADLLPAARRSAGHFGIARAEFVGSDMPIMGIAGDQQAALFGQGCWRPGEGKNTYGTGSFLLLNVGDDRPLTSAVLEGKRDGLLTTLGCSAAGDPVYVLEASIFIAGAAIQWLRDGLGIIATAEDSDRHARSIDSTDGVYFVPALAGLGAPHWEPEARGMITGLTRGTRREHLIRAALEAMAYGTRDVLDVMRARARPDLFDKSASVLRVDGGAAANEWLMQFQADVLNVAVERPDSVETTALGAAGLAGVSAGIWRDADHFLSARSFTRFEPGPGAEAARLGYAGWERAVRTTLSWARDHG